MIAQKMRWKKKMDMENSGLNPPLQLLCFYQSVVQSLGLDVSTLEVQYDSRHYTNHFQPSKVKKNSKALILVN